MPQPQKPHRQSMPASRATARPGQDIFTVKREAAKFPAVGMALPTYAYDSRNQGRRSAGQPTINKASRAAKVGRWRRFKDKITLKRSVITLAILVLLVGGWVGGKFLYNAHKIFGGNIFSALTTTKLKGEDSGRVNILLAGNSADDPGHDGGDLTDSIMVISIDTKNNKAFLLSVPRDLWTNIDDEGHQKINAAYVQGEDNNFSASGYPNGGMGLLEQTVSQDLGIPIDYYALVDYNAFRDAVNAVGGIDVNIQSQDSRGLYDPSVDYVTHGPLVKLSNGTHHLNGEQALDLARARGDSYYSYGFPASDFDRTEHQRQMLVALKSKAVSAGVLANPAKLSSLADALGNNVKTDLKLSEVRRLYDLTKSISGNNIQSLSLNDASGKNLLMSYQTFNGQSALIPAAGLDDFSDIQAFIKQQTSSDPVVREDADVVLLNATETSGLASKKRASLASAKNLHISATGNAQADQATTTIIDASGGKKPATRARLVQIFGNNVTTVNPYAGVYDADFIVLLGADQVPTVSGN
ncbi:MAG: LCP family protein [Candidatus Saccharimonadales bacterium]